MVRGINVFRAARAGAFVLAGAVAAACSPTAPSTGPRPLTGPTTAGGYPGFDTSIYPGDDAMRTWRQASPYVWVGYYLPAPCHRDASWSGRRDVLTRMGWGTAVLYLGQQDWAAIPGHAPADTTAADTTAADTAAPNPPPACSAAHLSEQRGATDAADAAARTASEGFPNGTIVYLDVERVQPVSPALVQYVAGWVGGMLDDGRFTPGIYAHRINVPELAGAAQAEFLERGRSGSIPFWVTTTSGFSLDQPPPTSGVAGARVWQGKLDTQETWGDVRMTIDVNIADSQSPSAP
jgi:hypothetical protein